MDEGCKVTNLVVVKHQNVTDVENCRILCVCPIINNNRYNKNDDEREEVNTEKDEIRCQKCDGACNCSDTEVLINTKLPKQNIEKLMIVPCVQMLTDEKKELSENVKDTINVEIHVEDRSEDSKNREKYTSGGDSIDTAGGDCVSKDKDANESSLVNIDDTGGTPMQEATEDYFDVAADTIVGENHTVGVRVSQEMVRAPLLTP